MSVLSVLGMANAVNLIDGLDGLAAGVVAIAAGSFFLYGHYLATAGVAVISPENPSPLIAVVVAGICLGFLPHNFNPGAHLHGRWWCTHAGRPHGRHHDAGGRADQRGVQRPGVLLLRPLFIPFFVMGVPIIDAAFAIVRRARKRASISEADKDHLHHRLMRLGHGHRRSVAILWLWTGLLSLFVLYPVYTGRGDGLVPIGVLALALVAAHVLPSRHPSGPPPPRPRRRSSVGLRRWRRRPPSRGGGGGRARHGHLGLRPRADDRT